MRISNRTRLVALSLAVASVAATRPARGIDNSCYWHQLPESTGGYIGWYDCGTCTSMYVWRPGDSGWTSAGSDC